MINREMPSEWRDLQNQVGLILRECGLDCEIEKTIQTVRGNVDIDVYAEDKSTQPTTIYLCECKHWQSAVPKTIIHAFRTVVSDYGANWGFVISSAGFQSGAFEAASNSNIRLITWTEFQDLFENRWIEQYMMPRLQELDPLVEYTEPINSRIFRKTDELNEHLQDRFVNLRKQYQDLAYLTLHHYLPYPIGMKSQLDLPLRNAIISENMTAKNIPDDVLDAVCLRDFVNAIYKYGYEGINAFDEIFGGRA